MFRLLPASVEEGPREVEEEKVEAFLPVGKRRETQNMSSAIYRCILPLSTDKGPANQQ